MTQRVNIQYSVNIEDLPVELERMAASAEDRLAKIIMAMEMHPQNMMTLEAHEYFDSIRVGLSGVDAILGDINNIIQSYLSFRTQQLTENPIPPAAPPGIDPNALPIPENLTDLHEKLAQFKQAMGDVGVSGEVSD
jgi:hypothetical protein